MLKFLGLFLASILVLLPIYIMIPLFYYEYTLAGVMFIPITICWVLTLCVYADKYT